MFSIVSDKVWNDFVCHFDQIGSSLLVTKSQFVLFADIIGQVAYVSMAPASEISVGSLQKIEQTSPFSFLPKNHGKR